MSDDLTHQQLLRMSPDEKALVQARNQEGAARAALVQALIFQGRLSEASEVAQTAEQQAEIDAVAQALDDDDDHHCHCPNPVIGVVANAAGEMIDRVAPRYYAERRIWSPNHGQFVTVWRATCCDHRNAHPGYPDEACAAVHRAQLEQGGLNQGPDTSVLKH